MNIKITEEQFKKLQEDINNIGFDSENTIPEYPQDEITASTKNGDDAYGRPMTGDEYQRDTCKNYPSAWGGPLSYAPWGYGRIIAEDSNTDNKFDAHPGTIETSANPKKNQFDNKESGDDLAGVPYSIIKVMRIFIDRVNAANLQDIKKMSVINHVLDKLNMNDMPIAYKKEGMNIIDNK